MKIKKLTKQPKTRNMKELQDLIKKWEKEVARIETNIKDSDDETHKRLNFHMKRQLRHCITDLKKLNMDAVERNYLIKFLTWIDQKTYFKEDNDIPIDFIVDEYQKLN